MAAKIAVLDTHQQLGDKAPTYVRRSVAQLMVRRQLAEWMLRDDEQKVIRLLGKQAPSVRAVDVLPSRVTGYVGPMPPPEVAGCRFDDPVKTPHAPRMMFLTAIERSQQCEV